MRPEKAFPIAIDDDTTEIQSGMNLRDWFAGQALTGNIEFLDDRSHESLASHCYKIADAMMKARKL